MFLENGVQHAWTPWKYLKLCFYVQYFQHTSQEISFVGYHRKTQMLFMHCVLIPFFSQPVSQNPTLLLSPLA